MVTEQTQHWQNWSGSVRSSLQQLVKPSNIAELARLLSHYSRTGRHVRVVGAGHSFTPLVETDDILLSLDNLQGVEEIDTEHGTATVLGGTRLKLLGETLLARGVAQENLGDIDVQSIAGAISTGTHGTGIHFGNLATQVEALTLVTASGEILECSAQQNSEIFKAAQVSLGLLGVIARVKLRVVPAKRLQFKSHRERLSTCLENLEDYKNNNSHFEFFWMPHTEWVQAKFLNETQAAATGSNLWGRFNKVVLENGLYWLLSECCRLVPSLTPTISKVSAQGIAAVDEVDFSHRLYATPRAVRFQEMEYNIPVEHFTTVLQEIKASIATHHTRVHFPVECRFVQADDIWLSPAYQRPSAYVAVHMYKGMPYREYFQQIEAIFKRYQGRPHWGKLHTQDAASLAQLYPHWDDFRRVRATLDPQGLFLNAYLRNLFAIPMPIASTTSASSSTVGQPAD
ncbi:D-arabinono-1,4-lactone oxidase [Dictyobacter kobayashii]|uniref:FAD-binding oxidoreductase n=1 Tax=Dictyobacter kobayashii TaxID=2014872 RepID=A0A402ATK4_9CHLR|nr:D-arabinono-1,4-lactone oxidase [Dictyobacter kobayashii]GCE22431.1 FAD-binding oxidoreductase [Dictyobacter kobayashii]